MRQVILFKVVTMKKYGGRKVKTHETFVSNFSRYNESIYLRALASQRASTFLTSDGSGIFLSHGEHGGECQDGEEENKDGLDELHVFWMEKFKKRVLSLAVCLSPST
jgi:hypothetical protein